MSYILEALRRAERERDMGKAPTVESLSRNAASRDGARAPLSVWIMAIATTLIAAAALTVLLWPQPHVEPAPSSAPIAPSSAPVSVQADDTSVAPPNSTDAAEPTATAIEDHDDVQSLDDVTGDTTELPIDTEASTTAEVTTTAAPGNRGDGDAETGAVQALAAVPMPATPVASGEPGSDTIMVPPGVTVLREMPASYREQFPVTALDVHVYDPDPAKRWIMVGGKRYREGETVASGPQITQITEAGVVFDYQGSRVLMPVR